MPVRKVEAKFTAATTLTSAVWPLHDMLCTRSHQWGDPRQHLTATQRRRKARLAGAAQNAWRCRGLCARWQPRLCLVRPAPAPCSYFGIQSSARRAGMCQANQLTTSDKRVLWTRLCSHLAASPPVPGTPPCCARPQVLKAFCTRLQRSCFFGDSCPSGLRPSGAPPAVGPDACCPRPAGFQQLGSRCRARTCWRAKAPELDCGIYPGSLRS